MQVIHTPTALLSNFEVLTLLRELDADHIARAKSAIRVKKEEATIEPHIEEVSENLRTVALETIQYLSADYHPTSRQSDHAIAQLVRDLAPFSLTKAEKLQVVNLAPTEPVELYVIVEEFEDRLTNRMHEILAIVSKSLSTTGETQGACPTNTLQSVGEYEPVQSWEHDIEDAEFDDFGDGIGVEGDLDMEDDD